MKLTFYAATCAALVCAAGACAVDVEPAQQVVDEIVAAADSGDTAQVHAILVGRELPTGVTTDDVLDQVLQTNDGGTVRAAFGWIARDAESADSSSAIRAGEAASILARYVADHSTELLNVDGPRTRSLGETKPEAVQTISEAIAPYMGSLAGLGDRFASPGFSDLDGGNPKRSSTKRLIAVVVSDRKAAEHFSTEAYALASEITDTYLDDALSGNPDPALPAAYGTIAGLLNRSVDIELDDRAQDAAARGESNSDDAPALYIDNDRLAGFLQPHYDFASALQRRDGVLHHDPRYDYLFDSGGRLRSIESLFDDTERNLKAVDSDVTNFVRNYRDNLVSSIITNFASDARETRTAVMNSE